VTPFPDLLERFRLAISGPAQGVPLARAALLVAQGERPGLDVDGYEAQLQEWAHQLEARTHPAAEPRAQLEAANELLFGELGFRGNEDDYADPRNLLLDEVIERRTGIPVTLAVVFIEVCRAAGLDVRGVGMPGHVIVRHAAADEDADERPYVDVFRGGALLSVAECEQIVRSIYGRASPFQAHFLDAVTPRQLLQRLLHNLKAGALRRGDEAQAERAIELLLTLAPWDLDEVRDRGRLRERIGSYAEALPDLETYLRHRPDARDAATIAESVRSLRRHSGAETS
jgi:regulator of sirC expression with transglutaminase-like and TPR domain